MEWEKILESTETRLPKRKKDPLQQFVRPIFSCTAAVDRYKEVFYAVVREHAHRHHLEETYDRYLETDTYVIFALHDEPHDSPRSRDHTFLIHDDGSLRSRPITTVTYEDGEDFVAGDILESEEIARHERIRDSIFVSVVGRGEAYVDLARAVDNITEYAVEDVVLEKLREGPPLDAAWIEEAIIKTYGIEKREEIPDAAINAFDIDLLAQSKTRDTHDFYRQDLQWKKDQEARSTAEAIHTVAMNAIERHLSAQQEQ